MGQAEISQEKLPFLAENQSCVYNKKMSDFDGQKCDTSHLKNKTLQSIEAA